MKKLKNAPKLSRKKNVLGKRSKSESDTSKNRVENADFCVFCGCIVPEGTMVCLECQKQN